VTGIAGALNGCEDNLYRNDSAIAELIGTDGDVDDLDDFEGFLEEDIDGPIVLDPFADCD
jgi:hypothetical protein